MRLGGAATGQSSGGASVSYTHKAQEHQVAFSCAARCVLQAHFSSDRDSFGSVAAPQYPVGMSQLFWRYTSDSVAYAKLLHPFVIIF